MPAPRPIRCLASLALALGLAACAARPGAPVWGADATLSPGWSQIGQAARKAATDPFTWAPAAGALALQLGGLDRDIADWAHDETPLFGSRRTADDASDWLRNASLTAWLGTGLAMPGGEDPASSKLKGFAAGGGALVATAGIAEGLKQATGRERPLDQDDASFPSRHAALAAASARLTRATLDHADLSPGARTASDAALAGLALATGWARVEAGAHFPADVLAGAALGNFLAVFATEAFLRPAGQLALHTSAHRGGAMLGLSLAF